MANLPEESVYESSIYQLEINDKVLAGTDGIVNLPFKQLANRTSFLKQFADEVEAARGNAATLSERIDDTETNLGVHNHDGIYQPVMGSDDNYVTDVEKAALHSHSNKSALDLVSGSNTGDQDLSGYVLSTSLATVATTGSYDDLNNKPTIPEAYVLPIASVDTLGGIKVDGTSISITDGVISAVVGEYTLPVASTLTTGGIRLFSDTQQTVAANTVTDTASRTYGLQINASNQAVINVPWTDTTYTNGTGLNLLDYTFSVNYGTTSSTACEGNDSRLSDSRTPIAHVLNSASHTVSGLTTGHFLKATGETSFDFVAHGLTAADVGAAATSHNQAESTITFTDITTGNASISAHGYLPKLSGTTTTYLRGDGTWQTVTGGATLSNDTSTNATYYPTFATATSGAMTTAKVSSTKLQFNPSTGTLSSTIFNSLSDRNFKKNILNLQDSLAVVKQLQGVSFEFTESNQKSYGFIAQDVENVIPDVVTTNSDGIKTLNYDAIIPFLCESIKQLSERIEFLENERI